MSTLVIRPIHLSSYGFDVFITITILNGLFSLLRKIQWILNGLFDIFQNCVFELKTLSLHISAPFTSKNLRLFNIMCVAVPHGDFNYFLIHMTDFGARNCVFELKTLSLHISGPVLSREFIFGHNVQHHCLLSSFWA